MRTSSRSPICRPYVPGVCSQNRIGISETRARQPTKSVKRHETELMGVHIPSPQEQQTRFHDPQARPFVFPPRKSDDPFSNLPVLPTTKRVIFFAQRLDRILVLMIRRMREK